MLHYCCTMHNDTHSVHNRLLKPWWGRPPCLQPFSRLLFSPVQTQLMPIVRCWGSGPPHPKSGVPTPRVRAHPFPRARNMSNQLCPRPTHVRTYSTSVHLLTNGFNTQPMSNQLCPRPTHFHTYSISVHLLTNGVNTQPMSNQLCPRPTHVHTYSTSVHAYRFAPIGGSPYLNYRAELPESQGQLSSLYVSLPRGSPL
jgi:hypothetical protein